MSNWVSIPKALELVTAPSGLAVSLEKVKAHCRLPSEAGWTEDNMLLTRFVNTAERLVQEQSETSLRESTWRLTLPWLPSACDYDPALIAIRLERPCPPLTGPAPEVDAVTYYNLDNESVVLDAADYSVVPFTPPVLFVPAEIRYNLKRRPNAFQVDFTSGTDTVCEAAEQAINLLVGYWYRNREAVGATPRDKPLALAFDSLIDLLRWRMYP